MKSVKIKELVKMGIEANVQQIKTNGREFSPFLPSKW